MVDVLTERQKKVPGWVGNYGQGHGFSSTLHASGSGDRVEVAMKARRAACRAGLVLGAVLAGLGCGADAPVSSTAATRNTGVSESRPAEAVLPVEELAEACLTGYTLQRRELSSVGIGYHYHYRQSQSGRSVILTLGVFATSAEAERAAILSHELMPDKPQPLSGIGDRAWQWVSTDGSAVRLQLGRVLLRVAAQSTPETTEQLARRMEAFIRARPALLKPGGPGFPRVRLLDCPERVRRNGRVTAFVAAEGGTGPLALGVWASSGKVSSPDSLGRFTFRVPRSGSDIVVRGFALTDDNLVGVTERTVKVTR